MASYTIIKPHAHPTGTPLSMLLTQSNKVTAYGVSWHGKLPNFPNRKQPTNMPADAGGNPVDADMVIWAFTPQFELDQTRNFSRDTSQPNLTLTDWVSQHDLATNEILVGWRYTAKDSSEPCKEEASGEACTDPDDSCDLRNFIIGNMSTGPQQGDYGISLISLGDKLAGASALLGTPEEEQYVYEVWRLKSSVDALNPNYSMSVATQALGRSVKEYRSHVKALTVAAMVELDLAQVYGLSIYQMTLLPYQSS